MRRDDVGRRGGRSPTAMRSAATPIRGPTVSPTSLSRRSRSRPAHGTSSSHATLVLGRAVGRVLAHLRGRPELLGVLGIPETLAPLCAAATVRTSGAFSRASTGRGRPTVAGSSSRSTATRRRDCGRRAPSKAKWRGSSGRGAAVARILARARVELAALGRARTRPRCRGPSAACRTRRRARLSRRRGSAARPRPRRRAWLCLARA